MIYDIFKIALNAACNISKVAIQTAYDINNNIVFSSGDEPVPTYYQVTYSLTHAISSTNVTSVQEGQSFSVTISAESGYELSSVSVIHNGMVVAPTGNTHTYNVSSVSGDIVVTATATAIVPQGFSWSNVKWVPIGDSLSDLTLTGKTLNPSDYKYQPYIQDLIPQMTVENYYSGGRFANGGCGYWCGSSHNFYTLSSLVPTDATIITLFGSVNDWKYRTISGSSYPNRLSKVNNRTTAESYPNNGRVTWIQNPHLDTVDDKTLAGYVASTLRRLHQRCPNAKIVVIPGLDYYGAGAEYKLNAYFCYCAVAQAMIDEENAGSWLSWETWYFDPQMTKSIDENGNVIYTRATTDHFVADMQQIDVWLEDNLNGTFASEKLRTQAFGSVYCYDYRTDGEAYGHWSNYYHHRYLAVKFAHALINNLGGTENDLPQELKYNNLT